MTSSPWKDWAARRQGSYCITAEHQCRGQILPGLTILSILLIHKQTNKQTKQDKQKLVWAETIRLEPFFERSPREGTAGTGWTKGGASGWGWSWSHSESTLSKPIEQPACCFIFENHSGLLSLVIGISSTGNKLTIGGLADNLVTMINTQFIIWLLTDLKNNLIMGLESWLSG